VALTGDIADRVIVGKTLAYTTITFRNSKGELAARGSHTKYERALAVPASCTDHARYVAQAWGAQPAFTAPSDMVADEEA